MRAWMLDAPGTPSSFYIKDVPVPKPEPGWVLIRVKAFGLNRSEHHTLVGECYLTKGRKQEAEQLT